MYTTMRCLIIIQLALCVLTGVTYANSVQGKSLTDENNRYERSADDGDEYGPIGPNEICKVNYKEIPKLTRYAYEKYCKKCEKGFENPDPKNSRNCRDPAVGVYGTVKPKNRDSSGSMAPTIETPTTPQTSGTITMEEPTTMEPTTTSDSTTTTPGPTTMEPTSKMKPTTMETTTPSDPKTTSALTTKNNNKKISPKQQSGSQSDDGIGLLILLTIAFILTLLHG